ncbi:MAG: A/G-specific adenine glycosylase [Treponema sp.]|jgi:A/G-specific adenine glycosylase|nr:A/G-specific adenine glycosylase [Treponema sp.]
MTIADFRRAVYDHYAAQGRSFPWRDRVEPWGVLVSEFMLQQTQTERVVPYWERWLRRWPTPAALHRASLEEALREWSGLGYNRRCRFLKDCARVITEERGGMVPDTPDTLRPLPGIGAYTSGAIACFAYDYPCVFIETNIRAAVLHCFFQGRDGITDAELSPILEQALDREHPRRWHWALMDYGAALKKSTVNPNRKSAHYTKQSRFAGSFRQKRGAVVRALTQGPAAVDDLASRTGLEAAALYETLAALQKDALVAEQNGVYRISDGS